MIYHILRGHVYHTSPSIVEMTLANADRVSKYTVSKHYFCILMFDKEMLYNIQNGEDIYIRIFEEYHTREYRFFYSLWEYFWFLLTRSASRNKIIYHEGLFAKDFCKIGLPMYLLKHKLLKRTSIVCWGANDYVKLGSSIKFMFFNWLRRLFFNTYRFVVTLSINDEKECKSLYPKSNVIYLPYMSIRKRHYTPKQLTSEKKIVMVSHSGWPHNNHLRSFQLLKKYSSKIIVICPLCYGEPNYIKTVIRDGETLFGDNFKYFTELMPLEKYNELLGEIDYYVSAADCQTGLGAIYQSMVSGVKIFLTGNLYNSLNQYGYKIFNLTQIETDSEAEFFKPLPKEIAESNVERYNSIQYEGEKTLSGWKNIYEY